MTGPATRTREHAAPLVNRENPWPGLSAFSEEQAEFFHGRDREVDDLFRRVRFNALSVLYGQSGLGKTSLVQAALFPRLRGIGVVPVSIRVDYSPGAPAARLQICQAISDAVDAVGGVAERLGEQESLWEYFHRERPAAADAAGKPLIIALAFDQFEEAFTLGSDRDDGRGFVRDLVEELGALAEHRPPSRVESAFERDPELVADFDFDRQDYRILVSLREDFLAHLHDLAERIPSITVNNMRLPPLDGSRALEVVERPGKGIVAPGAAEAIVRFVADAGDERRESGSRKDGDTGQKHSTRPIESLEVDPSLLSLFCRELNERRGAGLITPGLVTASREKILAEFYERALADQHPGVRVFVEEDLLTAKGFRQTLSVDSAEEKLRDYGASAEAVTTLVNRRLLHYEQRGRLTRVELTHDVLTRVVRESRNERQAKEAEESRRLEAEEAERRSEAARTRAESERAAAEAQVARLRTQQRLTRILLGVVALAAAAAVGFALWALDASRKARVQEQAAQVATRKAQNSEIAALAKADTLRAAQDTLVARQAALQASTALANASRADAERNLRVANTERVKANTERVKADAMLADFCTYGLTVINRFGDSTSGNSELSRAYNSLVEASDTAVGIMRGRSPEAPCPRLLNARVKSVSTGLLLDLADTAGALRRGSLGLAAAREMLPFTDSLSKSVAMQSFTDLNYSLFFAKNYRGSLEAAEEALKLARGINFTGDNRSYDRRARIYHYGALSWLRLGDAAKAHAWVDSGLAVTRAGGERSDQNRYGLLYTVSQLYIREAEADTMLATSADSGEAMTAYQRAVSAARARMALNHTTGSHTWLAQMHGWHGDMARRMRRNEDAVTAYDSSAAQWRGYLSEAWTRPDSVQAAEALDGVISAFVGRARAQLSLNRLVDAQASARAGILHADSLARIRAPTYRRRRERAQVFALLGEVAERQGQRAAGYDAYVVAMQLDSLNAVIAYERRPDTLTRHNTAEWYYAAAGRVATRVAARAAADTAGKVPAEQVRILREAEDLNRHYRENQLWAARRAANAVRPAGRREADSTVASALGNLSWSYLMVGRPGDAADSARVGTRVFAPLTFILPNLFNGLVLSGDTTAAGFFGTNATRLVEAQPIRFACAVVRDIRELRFRGVATADHVAAVERLAAPHLAQCPPLPTFPIP